MGKRSLKTTKNGKYMNPTDQARKEQRRRELKKNKKQRDVVRSAIIKSKEPKHIVEEMEMLDEMEYNPVQSSSLSLRVIQEKRRKLKETLDKIREMMVKDAPESVGEFHQMMANYEKRRAQRQLYYEQVKNAERVRPDQIPLPSELPPSANPPLPGDIPLPGRSSTGQPTHGILKKPPTIITESGGKVVFRSLKNIPHPPPCPPPDLSDSDDEQGEESSSSSSSDESSRSSDEESAVSSASPSDSGEESDAEQEVLKPKKSLRFADDVPQESTKDTRLTVGRERQQQKPARPEEDETPYDPEQPVESEPPRFFTQPPPPAGYVPLAYPPPLSAMMAPRIPLPPAFGTDMQAPRQVRRLPGGRLVLAGGPTVLQAGPTTAQRGDASQQLQQTQQLSHQMAPPPADPKVTTIEKKPQLKNLLHESTKFIPSQLKVRREYKDAHGRIIKQAAQSSRPMMATSSMMMSSSMSAQRTAAGASSSAAVSAAQAADKDDSYAQFMKSLDGLL